MKGDPFVGATLDGRYRLDGLIGRGGMASVYRGVDLTLERPVAVKVFAEAAEATHGLDDATRRKSETALLASLSHRALVRLYDAARDPATGREFLVMELVDGRDLRETLRLGPLGPADAAGLLADLAEALHVIHERGIVHRDVKPANVLLEPAHLPTRTWNAKLADFGIARLIDDARITRTGLLVGTPGYLSPEQVSGTPPTAAADIYSLGLLVLEARTGEAAFPGSAVEAASARLTRDPDIPESLGDDWVALLRAMTAREPDDRPSALDVALAAAQLDTSRPADEDGRDGSARADRRVRRRSGRGRPRPDCIHPRAARARPLVLRGAGGCDDRDPDHRRPPLRAARGARGRRRGGWSPLGAAADLDRTARGHRRGGRDIPAVGVERPGHEHDPRAAAQRSRRARCAPAATRRGGARMMRRRSTRRALVPSVMIAAGLAFGLSACAASADSTAAAMHASVVQISQRAADGDYVGAIAELALLERDVDAAVDNGVIDAAREQEIRTALDLVRRDLEAADLGTVPATTPAPDPGDAPAEEVDDPPGNSGDKGKGEKDKGDKGKGGGD